MADESYANKSRWRVLLPRKVRISNEMKGNGYIANFLEVVCPEMLLRMKKHFWVVGCLPFAWGSVVPPPLFGVIRPYTGYAVCG